MKKYITTNNHPELKEGVIVVNDMSPYIIMQECKIAIEPIMIDDWLDRNYIRELGPRWDDHDLIDLAVHVCSGENKGEKIGNIVRKWIDNHEKPNIRLKESQCISSPKKSRFQQRLDEAIEKKNKSES